jgi:general secretion pathway protein G
MSGRRTNARDGGFTLVELLIVIVVLGVLATVTVFAVRGITDRGRENAEQVDQRTLATAEEAHIAIHSVYGTETGLVTAGLLRDESEQHDITLTSGGLAYTIVPAGGGSPAPPPPPPPPPAPVPTTVAGFAGESFGSGSNRIVIISDGSAMSSDWATFIAGSPLPTTEVVFLGAGDVDSTADVDAIVATNPTYLVAAQSVPISSPSGSTFVGQYLSTQLAPSEFWWGHHQGGLHLMFAHYTSVVVPGG